MFDKGSHGFLYGSSSYSERKFYKSSHQKDTQKKYQSITKKVFAFCDNIVAQDALLIHLDIGYSVYSKFRSGVIRSSDTQHDAIEIAFSFGSRGHHPTLHTYNHNKHQGDSHDKDNGFEDYCEQIRKFKYSRESGISSFTKFKELHKNQKGWSYNKYPQ